MNDRSSQHAWDDNSKRLAKIVADLFLGLPTFVANLDNRLQGLADRVASQVQAVQELSLVAEKQNRLLQALVEKQEYLENASRQQVLLTEDHYRRHVLDPIARQLLPLIDHLREACANRGSASVRTLLTGIQTQLLDLLASHGIEAIESCPGEPFDPAFMRPVRKVPTFQADQDRTVARVLQVGFRRGDAVIRCQGVEVYAYETGHAVLVRHGDQEEDMSHEHRRY